MCIFFSMDWAFSRVLNKRYLGSCLYKLSIHNAVELSRQEERLSKQRALELFDEGLLDTFEVGTFAGLQAIHARLFCDVYDFAGEVRIGNIAKGSFRFAPSFYLDAALESISAMPRSIFDEIVEKIR